MVYGSFVYLHALKLKLTELLHHVFFFDFINLFLSLASRHCLHRLKGSCPFHLLFDGYLLLFTINVSHSRHTDFIRIKVGGPDRFSPELCLHRPRGYVTARSLTTLKRLKPNRCLISLAVFVSDAYRSGWLAIAVIDLELISAHLNLLVGHCVSLTDILSQHGQLLARQMLHKLIHTSWVLWD